MNVNRIEVTIMSKDDINDIVDYWHNSSDTHLESMGVDLSKLPTQENMVSYLETQISLPITEKTSFALIWWLDGKKIGHCNLNQIVYGEQAQLHLHIWDPSIRNKGAGSLLILESLDSFFRNMKLKRIYCEPYALNDAPNRTLKKVGFTLIKKHTIIPGSINFLQEVNHWEMTLGQFKDLEIS